MKSSRLEFKVKNWLTLVALGFFLSGCGQITAPQAERDSGRQQQESGESREVSAIVEARFVKGQEAPKLIAESFDGKKVDLSEFYGKKAVVLDFWAGWCPFCVNEMPELQKVQDLYKDDLVIIGVHRTDTEEIARAKKFADERGVSYLLIKDTDASLYRAAGGIGMPVAVFIDKKGIVQEVKSGPKTSGEIAQKVEALF